MADRVLRREEVISPYTPRVLPRTTPTRPAPGSGPEVRFGGIRVRVAPGTSLLEAAQTASVDLRSYCGGNCSCGTCRVEVPSASRRHLSRRQGMEELVLGSDATARGDRLACQAQVLGDVDVVIPDWF